MCLPWQFSKNYIKESERMLTSSLTSASEGFPVQFLASHAHSQRVHSAAAIPLSTALYIREREGLRETTPLFTIF